MCSKLPKIFLALIFFTLTLCIIHLEAKLDFEPKLLRGLQSEIELILKIGKKFSYMSYYFILCVWVYTV